MIKWLLIVIEILFLMKLFWNVWLPVRMLTSHNKIENKTRGSVSMMPIVEIFLYIPALVLSLILYVFTENISWYYNPWIVGVGGLVLAPLSYLGTQVVCIVGDRIQQEVN